MIKKLRRKFVIIIMALISAVLVTVFITLCVSTYSRLRTDTENAARITLDGGRIPTPFRPEIFPGRPRPDIDIARNIPTFYVMVSSEGSIVFSDFERVSISDSTAEAAVSSALESGKMSGKIDDFGLRFVIDKMQNGETAIAFADTSAEINGMRRIVLSSLAIGGGGLVVLFFISVFLAHLTIKPIEKAWISQQQFIADASHELKTPLTVIMANTGILSSHPDTMVHEHSQWIKSTQSEAEKMRSLVENMLELAKGDFTKEQLVLSSVNLSDIVTNSLLSFEPVAFEANAEITNDITPNLNITGDEEKLRRIIAILLDNAVKYTDHGGRIDVKLSRSASHIKLAVRNTGTVIPANHLPHIFDRFYRADESRSTDRSSFGLGLAIAQQIAHQHKAKIWAESSKESGTVFFVRF